MDKNIQVNDSSVRVQIWGNAGQEHFILLQDLIIRTKHVLLLSMISLIKNISKMLFLG